MFLLSFFIEGVEGVEGVEGGVAWGCWGCWVSNRNTIPSYLRHVFRPCLRDLSSKFGIISAIDKFKFKVKQESLRVWGTLNESCCARIRTYKKTQKKNKWWVSNRNTMKTGRLVEYKPICCAQLLLFSNQLLYCQNEWLCT